MKNNDLEYMMRDLQTDVKPSDNAVARLGNLQRYSSETFVGKRIRRMQMAVVLLLILLIPTAVFAVQSISQIIFEKTKDADITQKEREQIQENFEEIGITDPERIKEFDSLQRNENGQTYGSYIYDPDLIAMINDDDEIGYVYAEEFYWEDEIVDGFKTPEEVLAWKEEKEKIVAEQGYIKKMLIYESDGETVIGAYYYGSDRAWE